MGSRRLHWILDHIVFIRNTQILSILIFGYCLVVLGWAWESLLISSIICTASLYLMIMVSKKDS